MRLPDTSLWNENFCKGAVIEFKTCARVKFGHIYNWTRNMCEVSHVGSNYAEGDPCSCDAIIVHSETVGDMVKKYVPISPYNRL